jgi:hypothetical protein
MKAADFLLLSRISNKDHLRARVAERREFESYLSCMCNSSRLSEIKESGVQRKHATHLFCCCAALDFFGAMRSGCYDHYIRGWLAAEIGQVRLE